MRVSQVSIDGDSNKLCFTSVNRYNRKVIIAVRTFVLGTVLHSCAWCTDKCVNYSTVYKRFIFESFYNGRNNCECEIYELLYHMVTVYKLNLPLFEFL